MIDFSFLTNAHPGYVESLYEQFRENPESVEPDWRLFFHGYDYGVDTHPESGSQDKNVEHIKNEMKVLNLINGYRTRGHLFTRTNPVRERRKYLPTLSPETFGLSSDQLTVAFQAGHELGLGETSLQNIISHLEQTYCESVGVEYMFIRKPDRLKWVQKRLESTRSRTQYSKDEKLHVLNKLNQAVQFENFLHNRYTGQKRFALSGGETLIPALDALIERGAILGVREYCLGMSHRGRLNVLANIMQKPYQEILAEFEGDSFIEDQYEGDVKYHMGYSSNIITKNGYKIHLNLAPNPSHLEAADPVVEGMVRSKIEKRYAGDFNKIVPILIHGDAAIAGQGVVYEVIQMSLLDGYKTGGTIHLVINNQVGFTTNYLDGRSSTYCTDVAKVTLSPVFHVNADDVEAVVYAIQLAIEYRQTFHNDVFIDLLGYRKYGHNESDEPRFTQPRLYKIIASHSDPAVIYLNKLIRENIMTAEEEQKLQNQILTDLSDIQQETRTKHPKPLISSFEDDWKGYRVPADSDFMESTETGVDLEKLIQMGEKAFTIPNDLNVFDKIRKLYEQRKNKVLKNESFDWAVGELLAYASILSDGYPIRISGQDCERGTFSHRHAVVKLEDVEPVPHAEDEYMPLQVFNKNQVKFEIYNSLLSEYAVAGFEFGYAMSNPYGLVIWEAQFGDFANGAQTIFDQFLCSSQAKWKRINGLVLYLPHGYEGQGPDHSSARPERFLSLCANNNMQIVNCTTPANLFHVLRRQVLQPFRIPLIIFTPKSLLRHPQCVSSLNELASGTRFLEVMDDHAVEPENVRTIIFCWGKFYYELLERRNAEKLADVALVRLEQIYPLPVIQLKKLIDKYQAKAKGDIKFIWAQEEPENMGPWPFLRRKLTIARTWPVMRKESANTATGFYKQHRIEQNELLDRVFKLAKDNN